MRASLFIALVLLSYTLVHSQHTLSLEAGIASPQASIEDVAWISGHWQGEAFGGITEEIWSPPMGNSMMCVFSLINDGKVDFYEIETITEEQGSLILRLKHFHGNLKGWEEKDETVDFPLVKIEGKKAYFEGMTFERISHQEMNIYVVIGQDDGSVKEMEFAYTLDLLHLNCSTATTYFK